MEPELLTMRAVSKQYQGRMVLRGVSLTLSRGETVALVGPSGSGKSTLARCAAGLEQADQGEIVVPDRGLVQLIVQQPASSLNPRFTAREILEEPLVIRRLPREGAAARSLELVGLPSSALERRAMDFSGGERQRLAIARALAMEPALLILDESFAGLDWTLQNQMAELLRLLQQRMRLAYLLISHDLELVAGMAHRLMVIEGGEVVEEGAAAGVLNAPRHRLTRLLVEASRTLSLNRVEKAP